MRYLPTFLFTTSLLSGLVAQNTVGLITNDANNSMDGYTMFYPADQHTIFLVDNCGRLVHSWTDTTYTPGNAVYLMDNGDVVACGKSAGQLNPVIDRGGAGEVVLRKNWNNEILWLYTYNSPNHRMHHDVAMLPNGNVLILAWELKTRAQAAHAGRDTTGSQLMALWPEHIVEVEPLGIDTGAIVWEWHAWDHLVQNRSLGLPNFGVVGEHPERIDINYSSSTGADWMHANSIDYNAELDQILISVPNFNEVWVIDHSTTTAEAASTAGGNSGRGGDLLYRWGNPAAYGRGGEQSQKLFFEHDARWLGPGLAANDPDHGKIMVFNNRFGTTYSSVDMFTPPIDEFGSYTLFKNAPYGPDTVDWHYTAVVPESFFTGGLGSAHKLRNGNFFIGTGQQGQAREVHPNGTTVWEYKIPMEAGIPVPQGTQLTLGQSCFRASKYAADHPFLSTIALPAMGYIELDPDTAFCGSITVGMNQPRSVMGTSFFPNPTIGPVTFNTTSGAQIHVLDLAGKIVASDQATSNIHRLDLSFLAAGTYVVQVGQSRNELLILNK